jgi:PAS domain S-box-containing protein
LRNIPGYDALKGAGRAAKYLKGEYLIIALFAIAGLLFWLTDAVVDYTTFYDKPFINLLLFEKREVLFRLLATSFFIISGIFVARFFSKQKRTEEELRKTRNYLQSIIETEPACVKLLSPEGTLLDMNRAGLAMIQADSLDQVQGNPVAGLLLPEYREAFRSLVDKTFGGSSEVMEFEMVGLKGKRLWLETHAVPIRNAEGKIFASLGITRDITERKRAEEQIMSALREKDILLKEIHHRVKNNLQVVASLLDLQSRSIEDRQARMLFGESQKRIETMTLIHEKLYQSKDLARIDFTEYVDDLTAQIFALHEGRSDLIDLKADVRNVILDVNKAIPCGLIINELVSNALKHAFTGGERGTVSIRMHAHNEGGVTLSVSDDGKGFPEGVDYLNTKSLGMQLIISLVDQLGGIIKLEGGKGTTFVITFQGAPNAKRA